MTFENKLKQWATRETAELQQFSTDAVRKWSNGAVQDVELGMTQPGGTICAPFPPIGLSRDCPYYTSSVLSEEEALQDIARSEVQKPAWVQIYRNNADRLEKPRSISSNQELE